MKKIILITLILIPCFLFSQIQWQNNGMPVYCGENVNWTGTTINSDDGNMVMIWSDSRNGDRGVFAQKITPNGDLLWGEEGIEINDDLDTQHSPVATTTMNNEIIIAWVSHYGNFDMEIRVQKIDAFGNRLWQDEGILLFTDIEGFPYRIQIIDDLVGGAFVVWRNYTLESDPVTVKGLHVLADGSIDSNWNAGGNILIQNLQPYNFDILPDGYGGFIYAWRSLDNLKIQRIGSNGNPLWGDVGIILCEETVCSDHIGVVSDNNGLFYFFWKDSRNTNNNMIYMQKVDINGTVLFPEDINIYTTDNSLSRIDAIFTSDENLALCWAENVNSQSFLKTLKLDTFGNSLFDPINIYNGAYSCYNIGIISDNNGGYWMKWFCFDNAEELYVQHIDESGAITLNNNGLFICEAIQSICIFTLNLTSDNRAFLSWVDEATRSNTLYAQVVDDLGNIQFPENGIIIHEGPSGYVSTLKIIPNEDNPFFLWINNIDYGGSHIFTQSLNSDGSPVFEENGISIMQSLSSDFEEYEVDHQNNNFIIITNELINNSYKAVTAQSFDSNGNSLWEEDGIFVTSSDWHQYNVHISSHDNFIYAGWTEFDLGWSNSVTRVSAQKLDENGNLLWGEEGVVITDREGDDNLQDIVNRYFIWQNISGSNVDIYAKLVDENGDPAPGWPENGLEVCVAEGSQQKARGIIIPQGLLILWEDYRDGYSEKDIYGQVITPDGNILWQQNGLPLVAQPYGQFDFSFQFEDFLYLVWQDHRSGENYEIYVQKFDENGDELWQEGGILIGEGHFPDIVKIGNNLVIVWEKLSEYNLDIYAQLIDLDGNLLWNPDGIVLCDASWDQRKPQIVTNESDNVYIGWLDDRIFNYDPYGGFATSVFAQKIHLEPSFSPDDILNAFTAKLYQNYPNPFNPETTISFSVTQTSSFVNLEIYNLRGQKVKDLSPSLCHPEFIEGRGEIKYSVVWDGTDDNNKLVSSGVYFYKLKSGNFEKSKKMVLLK